jgi:hypothetical protein
MKRNVYKVPFVLFKERMNGKKRERMSEGSNRKTRREGICVEWKGMKRN